MLLCSERVTLPNTPLCSRSLESAFPSQRWLTEHERDYILILERVQPFDHFRTQCIALPYPADVIGVVKQDVQKSSQTGLRFLTEQHRQCL
jgi:hypothetical protein